MDELTLRRMLETSASGTPTASGCCLSLDVHGTIVWAARATHEMGWAPEELTGRNVSVLVPRLAALLGPLERAQILQAGAQEGPTVVDVGVRRDGRLFEAAVDVAARRSSVGGLIGLTVVVRDATVELEQRRSKRLARDREPVLVLGRDFAIRYATRPAWDLLGLRSGDIFPGLGEGLVHADDRLAVSEAVDRLLKDPTHVERRVIRLRGAGGGWRSLEATISNCLDNHELAGLVARLRDVSAEQVGNDQARLSAALHRAMVETSDEGVVVTGEDGAIRYVNVAALRILGLTEDQVRDVDLRTVLVLHGTGTGREEVVYRHPAGAERILVVTRSPLGEEGAGLGSLTTLVDVTESRISEQDLLRRALYDPLTGLPNRYLVRDRLDMAAARQVRAEGGSTAVVFIDLDDFKPVNDTYGHDAGDELLRHVAARLVSAVRTSDTVGRVGGDEFVVVCEDIDDAAIAVVTGRIQRALADPVPLSTGPVRVAASIGVALSPPYPFERLLQEADSAMYRAKRAGSGVTVIASPEDLG